MRRLSNPLLLAVFAPCIFSYIEHHYSENSYTRADFTPLIISFSFPHLLDTVVSPFMPLHPFAQSSFFSHTLSRLQGYL